MRKIYTNPQSGPENSKKVPKKHLTDTYLCSTMFTDRKKNSTQNTGGIKMIMKKYYVQAPNIMWGEFKRLTEKQVEQLRKAGYTVTR